jgi:hypothetical protein
LNRAQSARVETVLREAGVFLFAVTLSVAPAGAQVVTGTPGSPDATTTVDSRYLPAPPAKFSGEIGLTVAQSKPSWPARIVPPKGAPNILLILTDDVGFGAPTLRLRLAATGAPRAAWPRDSTERRDYFSTV